MGFSAFLGQSPHWDTKNNVLYYTDNQSGTIFKYDQNNNKFNMTKIRKFSILLTPKLF